MTKIVVQALNEVIIPVLVKLDEKTDRIEKKLDASISRLDNHGERIQKLENQASIAS